MDSPEAAPEIREAAETIRGCHHAVALVGAGLSAESGIPTYRGTDGIWTKFGEPTIDGWELFRRDPEQWWRDALDRKNRRSEFSTAIESAEPNAGHLALAELERMGRLQHIITQNIDNLHQRAGSVAVTEIHGNRTKARCLSCGERVPLEQVSLDRLPPLCAKCGGIMKNDTVMFGEPIPSDALRRCQVQANAADVFLVIGTSAVVYPAADFPVIAVRHGATLIEINPERTPLSSLANIIIRGPAGESLKCIVDLLSA
ncbi:MAG TPA: NAD-dependent deacylase [Tepidiformaceae bacterium]